MVEIIDTDDSVANTIDGKIYLNKHLREFPELRQRIIAHELEHSKAHGFWKNRQIDAFTDLSFKDMIPYYKKYPKDFLQQNLPIFYKDKTLYLNWSIIFLLTIYAGIGILIYFLIRWFSNDQAVFGAVIKNILWLLPTVIIVYWLLKKFFKQANKEAKDSSK